MEAMLMLIDHQQGIMLKEQPNIDAAGLAAETDAKKAKIQKEIDADAATPHPGVRLHTDWKSSSDDEDKFMVNKATFVAHMQSLITGKARRIMG